jgi:hypothetical protein
MNRNYEGGIRYTTQIGHDTERDCACLELHWRCKEQDVLVAAIFAPYRDRSWSLNTLECDIPLELIEEMIEEARSALKYGDENCKRI